MLRGGVSRLMADEWRIRHLVETDQVAGRIRLGGRLAWRSRRWLSTGAAGAHGVGHSGCDDAYCFGELESGQVRQLQSKTDQLSAIHTLPAWYTCPSGLAL